MNAEATKLAADRHPLREPRRPRRPGALLERPRRHPPRPDRDEEPGRPRDRPARGRRRSPAARTLTTWNDLLSSYPGVFGVKTGHTNAAGWSEVAAARSHGVTVYATLLGGRDPRRPERRPLRAAHLGALPVPDGARDLARPRLRDRDGPVRAQAAGAGRRAAGHPARPRRPDARQRVVAPATVSLPVRKGQRLGAVAVYAGAKLLASRPLVASRTIAKPGFVGRTGWYAGRTLHHMAGWFS